MGAELLRLTGVMLFMDIAGFWNGVTAPQATIVSAVVTALAALGAVIFGWWLFSGRVNSLKEALEHSEDLMKGHTEAVQANLKAHSDGIDSEIARVNRRIAQLAEDIVVNVTTIQSLRADIADAETQEVPEATTGVGTDAAPRKSERLRSDWNAIRNWLETIASSPAVDGRTRARYARIDRRQYWALVDALTKPKDLLDGQHDQYSDAVALWHKYRNGRVEPTDEDLTQMAELRRLLVPKEQEQ